MSVCSSTTVIFLLKSCASKFSHDLFSHFAVWTSSEQEIHDRKLQVRMQARLRISVQRQSLVLWRTNDGRRVSENGSGVSNKVLLVLLMYRVQYISCKIIFSFCHPMMIEFKSMLSIEVICQEYNIMLPLRNMIIYHIKTTKLSIVTFVVFCRFQTLKCRIAGASHVKQSLIVMLLVVIISWFTSQKSWPSSSPRPVHHDIIVRVNLRTS